MYYKSKKTTLIILAITAIVCSKVLFSLFNDPEGANLVVVTGMALIVFLLSLIVYVFKSSTTGFKKLLLAILIQIIVTAGSYFFLK